MERHPLVGVPLHLTESVSIHLAREVIGDERTADLTERLLSAEQQQHLSQRHPNQSFSLAEARAS
jgi:hypothetical protein